MDNQFNMADYHDANGNLLPAILPSTNGKHEQQSITATDRLPQPASDDDPTITEAERLFSQMPIEIQQQAYKVLEYDDPLQVAVDDIHALGMIGEVRLIKTLYLAATSRLLDKPVSVIVQGGSSSGKSYTINCVAAAIPLEAKVQTHSMTPQALYYVAKDQLCHKFVINGERSLNPDPASMDATKALRELIGDGQLSKLVTIKKDGRHMTETLTMNGPISYVESTTAGNIFDEDRNRCLLVHTDESKDQTERIMKRQTEVVQRDEMAQQRQHAIQRLLSPYSVAIPFSDKLLAVMPSERIEARRMFPMLLNIIRASALLHQYQRQQDPEGRLIATHDDYQIARDIVQQPMNEAFGLSVSKQASELYYWLADNMESNGFGSTLPFCKRDVADNRQLGWGKSRVYSLLSELDQNGLLVFAHKSGQTTYYTISKQHQPDNSACCLPEVL